MGQLYLLSPERAEDCGGVIEPNETYEVTDFQEFPEFDRAYVDFIIPELLPHVQCECITLAAHLRNGGRWLLLERID